MNDDQTFDDVPFQTVDLDNPQSAVLFVEGDPNSPFPQTRVYYDVGTIVSVYTQEILRNTMNLMSNPSTDTPEQRAYLLGQTDMVQHMISQAEGFRQVYDARKALAGIDTPADFFTE